MIQPNPAIEILSHLLPRHFFKDAIFHRAKPREKPFHLHANHTPARLHLSRALNSLNSLQQHPIWRKKKRNLLALRKEEREERERGKRKQNSNQNGFERRDSNSRFKYNNGLPKHVGGETGAVSGARKRVGIVRRANKREAGVQVRAPSPWMAEYQR